MRKQVLIVMLCGLVVALAGCATTGGGDGPVLAEADVESVAALAAATWLDRTDPDDREALRTRMIEACDAAEAALGGDLGALAGTELVDAALAYLPDTCRGLAREVLKRLLSRIDVPVDEIDTQTLAYVKAFVRGVRAGAEGYR